MDTQTIYNLATGETMTAPYERPEPDPAALRAAIPALTFSQLLIGLVAEGWITEAEGDAWLDGTLPEAVHGLIQVLPPEEQFPARARAKRLVEASRLDPLVVMLASLEGKTDQEMDAFFEAWSAA